MKKIMALLTALLMVLPLVACVKGGQGESTTTVTDTQVSTGNVASGETTATSVEPVPAKKQLLYDTTDEEVAKLGLDGYTFHIFQRKSGTMWMVHDLVTESNGEVFNDAIYERYAAIQDRFGLTMEMHYSKGNHAEELATYLNAGDDTYDLAFPSAQQCAVLAQQGLLTNLYDLDYFDIDSGNWSRMFCDEMQWQDKLYFAMGDISTNSYRSIRIFLFNKEMHEQNQMEDIYTAVREKRWTIDMMNEMATTVAKDLNGDGEMAVLDDQWGMVWQKAISGYTLFYGADERLTVKGEDGIPQFTLGRERTQTVFQKIRDVIGNQGVYYQGTDEDGPLCFKEGRSLFYTAVLNVTEQLRDSTVDFGIVPTPKYDEAQEQYIQYVDSWCPSPVVVPFNVQNPARCGFLIQLLAETGAEFTKPAYYDIVLTSKYARDPDSVEMLDIIVHNYRLDNAVLYDWSGYSKAVLGAFTGNGGLSSLASSLKTPVTKAIEMTAKKYDSFG